MLATSGRSCQAKAAVRGGAAGGAQHQPRGRSRSMISRTGRARPGAVQSLSEVAPRRPNSPQTAHARAPLPGQLRDVRLARACRERRRPHSLDRQATARKGARR